MTTWKYPLFKVHAPPWDKAAPLLKQAWESGYWAEGEQVAEFESKLADFFGTPNVFATNACTSALTIALKMAGIGGGLTIAPPMTCIATIAPAVSALGHKIVWADVDPKTGLISPESVSAIFARGYVDGFIRAVIGVDWGGDVCDTLALGKIAREHGAVFVEDAAQALGTEAEGADYRCFSFQAIKFLTTGDGGCCVTRTAEDAERGKSLSWFGIDRKNFRLPSGEIDWEADVPEIGFKANMNNLAAAIGLLQMAYLPKILAQHEKNAFAYEDEILGIDEIELVSRPRGSSCWVYTILADHRDELMAHLQEHGIQASMMHTRLDRYSGIPTVGNPNLPGVDEFSARHLCLPCGWWMDADNVRDIATTIREFYAKKEGE